MLTYCLLSLSVLLLHPAPMTEPTVARQTEPASWIECVAATGLTIRILFSHRVISIQVLEVKGGGFLFFKMLAFQVSVAAILCVGLVMASPLTSIFDEFQDYEEEEEKAEKPTIFFTIDDGPGTYGRRSFLFSLCQFSIDVIVNKLWARFFFHEYLLNSTHLTYASYWSKPALASL